MTLYILILALDGDECVASRSDRFTSR